MYSYLRPGCGYSKETATRDSSFDHKKQMFKLMDKKLLTILGLIFLFTQQAFS